MLAPGRRASQTTTAGSDSISVSPASTPSAVVPIRAGTRNCSPRVSNAGRIDCP